MFAWFRYLSRVPSYAYAIRNTFHASSNRLKSNSHHAFKYIDNLLDIFYNILIFNRIGSSVATSNNFGVS